VSRLAHIERQGLVFSGRLLRLHSMRAETCVTGEEVVRRSTKKIGDQRKFALQLWHRRLPTSIENSVQLFVAFNS